MAFLSVAARGYAVSDSSGTVISVSPSARLERYRIVFVSCVTDNTATADGSSNNHSLADSKGNTWTKVFEETDSAGAAADGSTTSLWWSRIIYPIETSDTITLTLSTARVDKIISIVEVTVGTGKTVSTGASTALAHSDSGTSLSATLSGMTSREYLFFGLFGAEGEDTAKSPIANYTEQFDLVSSTAGAADVNVQMHVGTRIYTATGDTWTSSSVTFTNGVQSLTAFYEIDDSNRYGALESTIAAITPTGVGTVEVQGTLSASIDTIGISASGAVASSGSGAVSYRSGTTAGSANGGNLTIDCPSGVQDGDILIAVLYREGGTWTLPTGWSQIAEVQDRDSVLWLTVAWKRASSEGSSYTFTLSTTTWRTALMAAFSGGVASGDPYNTYATRQADNATDYTVKAASITTTVNGSMRVAAHANVNGDNIGVASSGMTQGPELGGVELFYELDSTAGASGTETFTDTNYTARWVSIHLDIEPEVTGGINGTLTQSIGTIGISASGTVEVQGSLSAGIGAIGISAVGAIEVRGNLTAAIGTIGISAAGAVEVQGALTAPIGTIAVTGAGTVGGGISGVLEQSIGTVTLSGAGTVDVTGGLSASVGSITLSAAGQVEVRGVLSASIGAIGVTGSGVVEVRGALTQSIGTVTISAAGTVEVRGALTQSIGTITLSAVCEIIGTGQISLYADMHITTHLSHEMIITRSIVDECEIITALERDADITRTWTSEAKITTEIGV